MINGLKTSFLIVAIGLSMSASSPLAAQEFDGRARLDEGHDESLYYQQPSHRPDTRAIIHQKAQARASQRQARLASLAWYSMSTGRPATASTPFTTHRGPVCLFPSSRPVAWHSSGWPTYVYYAR